MLRESLLQVQNWMLPAKHATPPIGIREHHRNTYPPPQSSPRNRHDTECKHCKTDKRLTLTLPCDECTPKRNIGRATIA